jgi:hypothetical protein
VKPYRVHDDPWLEAERLEVADICRRMGWTRRKLNAELDRVASPEAFIARVFRALGDLDAPRLMHRVVGQPPTSNPALAAKGEAEMVPEAYENDLATLNREKDSERRMTINSDRKKRPIDRRLVLCLAEARNRGIAIGSQLGAIERQIERIEKRLDRVA